MTIRGLYSSFRRMGFGLQVAACLVAVVALAIGRTELEAAYRRWWINH